MVSRGLIAHNAITVSRLNLWKGLYMKLNIYVLAILFAPVGFYLFFSILKYCTGDEEYFELTFITIAHMRKISLDLMYPREFCFRLDHQMVVIVTLVTVENEQQEALMAAVAFMT